MPKPSDVELVQEFAMHLRVERSLSPNTVLAYSTDLFQFSEFLSKKHIILFVADKQHVAGFLQHLATHEIEPRSRARKISALKRFYRWLILAERIEKDPMRLTVAPKLPRLLPRPVDQEYMETMLERSAFTAAADVADAFAIRDHAILSTFYGGGLRASELCGMREADVNLNTGLARVLGKGSKQRIVPLGDDAIAAIQEYLKSARPELKKHKKNEKTSSKDSRALFLSQVGRQITRQRVHQIVVRQGNAGAGDGPAQHVHPHRLRHSCATDMLAGGGDLRAVQEQLGHGSIATTQIYTKVSPAHLQEAHAKYHPRGAVRKKRS